MNSIPSTTYLRKRRFLAVLPLLVCPFLIVFFWVLGGGSASAAGNNPVRTAGGLNLALPGAKLKDESRLTKMDYYRKADQDSAKRRTLAKTDPFYHLPGLSNNGNAKPSIPPVPSWGATRSMTAKRLGDSDRNEALVYRKLALLNATLSSKAPAMPPATASPVELSSQSSPGISRMEHLVQSLHSRDTTEDPELRQLGGLLDKLAALQQPAAGHIAPSAAIKQDTVSSTVNFVLPADLSARQPTPSKYAPGDTVTDRLDVNGFYPEDEMAGQARSGGTIPAVVNETVTVINGSTVSLRLQASVRVKGLVIPTGTLAYGTVQLSGDRVSMIIRSLQYLQQPIAVALTVYGLDGLPGIPAPTSVTRDVAKQSADASVQSIGLTTLDQSIGAQAATAGIQAAKTMLSRKVRLVTVTLPAGYQVLLKDNAQH